MTPDVLFLKATLLTSNPAIFVEHMAKVEVDVLTGATSIALKTGDKVAVAEFFKVLQGSLDKMRDEIISAL